jgi:hypothetical protein
MSAQQKAGCGAAYLMEEISGWTAKGTSSLLYDKGVRD